MQKRNEWKTAFHTRDGHSEYLVTPLGLCDERATFQHVVNDILKELLENCVVAYLDDILILFTNEKVCLDHVWVVLSCLHSPSSTPNSRIAPSASI